MKAEKLARKGLAIINRHKGKKITYETYKKVDPEIAEKYLCFIANHSGVQYIRWDAAKRRFVA